MFGKLCKNQTVFFCCDIQEKFRNVIQKFPDITAVSYRLITASKILGIPLIVTEQYPKGLGHTIKELNIEHSKLFEKTLFSMCTDEVRTYLKNEQKNVKSVVIFGVEAHVCVQQTVIDLLGLGYEVHVVADGVSSRSFYDRSIAIQRMRQSGAFVSTHESLIFALLENAKHENFKEVQNLTKKLIPELTFDEQK